jgi:hypothetical protein
MRPIGFPPLLAALASTGSATGGGAPAMTPLQIREYQTRSFDTQDAKPVMKALLNVLMDEGYIVKEANVELGVLGAARELNIEDKGKAFMSRLILGGNARWDKNSIVEVTANFSLRGDRTRVRASVQLKTVDNKGLALKIRVMDDEALYQEFFAKVDKGIFIEKEKL